MKIQFFEEVVFLLNGLTYLELNNIDYIIKNITINTLSNILIGEYNRDKIFKMKDSKIRNVIKKYIE